MNHDGIDCGARSIRCSLVRNQAPGYYSLMLGFWCSLYWKMVPFTFAPSAGRHNRCVSCAEPQIPVECTSRLYRTVPVQVPVVELRFGIHAPSKDSSCIGFVVV